MTVGELLEHFDFIDKDLELIGQFGPHYYPLTIDVQVFHYKQYPDRKGGVIQDKEPINCVLCKFQTN